MKADVETLRDTFKVGYEAYEASRHEAETVWNLFHNRQYTADQLATLENRGQPKETFNVIKLFARMLIGYYSTVVNTATAMPTKESEIYTAALINDIMAYTFRTNSFSAEGDTIKLGGIISGLFISYINVIPTGETDRFGRPLNKIEIEHVPDNEVILDPMSRKDDYSDGRYIHRFKWVAEDEVRNLYGQKKLDELEAYYNHVDIEGAEFEYSYNGEFTGYYKIFDNYLIVHSVLIDDDGRTWSVHWSNMVELFRKEITFKNVRMPYRVQKLHTSDRTEHYGIFREIIETQHAINQALIKIQLMASTQKAYVEEGAVDNIADFTSAFNRVSSVVEVTDLTGIKIENMSREVLDQYTIIDKAFDRIQQILSINDSFLGMAFASDSGRKVKLQQNATITALRYLTGRIEQFYRLLGWDVANLIKQFYTAEQGLRITDETTGSRWVYINTPMEIPTGELSPDGQPIVEYAFEEVIDPASGKVLEDDEGNLLFAPIPEEETEIAFTDVEIEINTTAYNDEDEKNQLLLETILSGNIGQLLSQVNPAGYFQAASLSLKSMKTKNSPDIAKILADTAQRLGGDPAFAEAASLMAQGQTPGQGGSLSQQLKLPQNTNEGVD